MKRTPAQKTPLAAKELLATLVGFDTTSSKSNLALIDWVRDYLDGYGISSTLLPDASGAKASLHAMIGPEERAGFMLSGHTDVVPVEGQNWSSDPFVLRERDGLLHGRGTCDMKGFIAAALAKVPQMVKRPLETPIHFAFSYDEEVGCLGAHEIAAHLSRLAVKPRLCVVGEPTSMKAITGHKGICAQDCTVHGREAHSSLAPAAVNAVEYGAELVAYIKSVARRMASEGPFNRQFDPPFTTVHTGTIRGGTAINIVPNRCDISFEIRAIPGVDAEALVEEIRHYAFRTLEPRMKDVDPTTGFEFRAAASVPAFDIANDHPAVEMVLSFSGANATEKVSFGTEAGIFQKEGGVPTVVCGPGSIAQAHKPDEFISLEQLTKCERFLDRLVERAQTAA